ncbi:GNAT family N-acetyltransferase [Flavobacterium crassostreae]|uniref:Uncharacterized protein n=1 Tax=Flavobacterium crassostreae TaxID=1763534 RepID=A0A1B9E0D4_9FLAO|nr:GNAT family N-acetyltransferase [Flavobacterium crassostreae]OCB75368.1 hypothetical protein LPBF_08210 [Flavobacterium crassostreae]
MLHLEKYHPNHKSKWDAFVSESKNGVFLFYREYLEYHQERFVDHSLIFLKKNKIIALFPANQSGMEIFSHAGLTFGSLLIGNAIKASEVMALFGLLKAYYQNLGFTKITYKAIPSIYHRYPADEDLYALFINKATLVRRDLASVIQLENKIGFSQTKKQSVTKCIQNQITITQNNDLEEYWDLLTNVLSKFGVKPVHSYKEITHLKALFPDKIQLYEARKNNVLLAGIVIYDYKQVVHTQYMANSEEGRKIGALNYINAHLISQVYQHRKYYSLGTSMQDHGLLNEGLIQQKELMGSRAIAIDFYELIL